MGLDEFVEEIEALESQGFIVLLKWDGERTSARRTVVIAKPGVEGCYHCDSDDLGKMIQEGVAWAKARADS